MTLRRALTAALLLGALGCPPPSPLPDAGPNDWRVVLDQLPGTLLSAWESSEGVLYAVGGDSTSALVLRHDANGWWRMDPGTSRTLWWVHGFSANDVYAVGAEGVVTHFDGTRWTVEREGGDFTLFGAWGATAEDLVAVGGVVTASSPRPAMVSRTAGWAEISTAGLPQDRALFKVWGTSARDLFVVGERGLVARGSPGRFSVQRVPATDRLTTVHGAGGEVFAVGGLQAPVMLRFDGVRWAAVPVAGTPQFLTGVAVNGAGEVLVVGFDGYLAEGRANSFEVRAPLTRRGLHGAAVTREGFVAVGGELLGAFGNGVLLARGKLEAGPLQTWPTRGVRFDAGVDAGLDAGGDAGIDAGDDAGFDGGAEDAGPPDAGSPDAGQDAGQDAGAPDGGWLGPGASCDVDPTACQPGLACWFVFGPFKNFCAARCTDSSECGAYGAGACCTLPGPQVTTPVCLPFDAGVCDAGS
jgi:hypothetical protein